MAEVRRQRSEAGKSRDARCGDLGFTRAYPDAACLVVGQIASEWVRPFLEDIGRRKDKKDDRDGKIERSPGGFAPHQI